MAVAEKTTPAILPPPWAPKRDRKANGAVFRVVRRGAQESFGSTLLNDLYHFMRTASWMRVFGLMAAAFLLINIVFAAVLYFSHAEILNAHPGSFADRFWFSVQTMATIGYGYLSPMDNVANVIVTVESFVGIVFTAMVTGICFSKFSTANARVLFSKSIAISDHEGRPALMFRMANERSTAIVEATVKVSMIRDEVLPSGERLRRFYDMSLRRHQSPTFALSWTVYHSIDATSPLWTLTPAELAAANTGFIVTFTGIDDSLAATVHTRHTYTFADMHWHSRLVDIVSNEIGDDGIPVRVIDYTRFHEVEPAALTPIGPHDPTAADIAALAAASFNP